MFSLLTMSDSDTTRQPGAIPLPMVFLRQAGPQPMDKIIGQTSVAVKADERDAGDAGNRDEGVEASQGGSVTEGVREAADRAGIENI